jgi:hypothetical protein
MDLIWSVLFVLFEGFASLGHRIEKTFVETGADGTDPFPPPPN